MSTGIIEKLIIPAVDGEVHHTALMAVPPSSTAMSTMRIVKFNSARGKGGLKVSAFDPTVETDFDHPIGILTHPIQANNENRAFSFRREGVISGTPSSPINTSGLTIGDPVYIGANGAPVFTAPTSSSAAVLAKIGYVTFVHATLGRWFFCPQPYRHTWRKFAVTATAVESELIYLTWADDAVSASWAPARACHIIESWIVKGTGTGAAASTVLLKAGSDTVYSYDTDGLTPGEVVYAASLHATHRVLAAAEAVTFDANGLTTAGSGFVRVMYV